MMNIAFKVCQKIFFRRDIVFTQFPFVKTIRMIQLKLNETVQIGILRILKNLL